MSRCRQQVRNKLATCRSNGIWEATRHNRLSGLLPAPTCYRLVTDLLQTCIRFSDACIDTTVRKPNAVSIVYLPTRSRREGYKLIRLRISPYIVADHWT